MITNKTSKEIESENKIIAEVKQKQKPTTILKYKLTPHNGHTIYEVNYESKIIRPADIITPSAVGYLTWKEDIKKWSVLERENCIYISCLNMSNVVKHAKRILINENFEEYTFLNDSVKGNTEITVNIVNYKHQ